MFYSILTHTWKICTNQHLLSSQISYSATGKKLSPVKMRFLITDFESMKITTELNVFFSLNQKPENNFIICLCEENLFSPGPWPQPRHHCRVPFDEWDSKWEVLEAVLMRIALCNLFMRLFLCSKGQRIMKHNVVVVHSFIYFFIDSGRTFKERLILVSEEMKHWKQPKQQTKNNFLQHCYKVKQKRHYFSSQSSTLSHWNLVSSDESGRWRQGRWRAFPSGSPAILVAGFKQVTSSHCVSFTFLILGTVTLTPFSK